jgi:orotate phosphoribosyltransferase
MIERLKELFHELDCIKYGRFPLASGGFSNYKIECDNLFKNQEAREILGAIGYGMLEQIERKHGVCNLIGVMQGGYNFGKIVADIDGRDIAGVNPHNTGVIGKVDEKLPDIWWEDVVTRGKSTIKCESILYGERQRKGYVRAIVDRLQGGRKNFEAAGMEFEAIMTKDDLGITL